ncbi:MAG: 2-C-methyl-D-erythritol 4-phosphate cytidylyltransferase [Chloroflexota bacterium]
MNTVSVGMVLVGAGSGQRMNGIDKVWSSLGAHPIVWHSLNRFASEVRHLVLVVRSDQLADARALAAGIPNVCVVAGGAQRQDSVASGLQALEPVDIVAIHDVARPFATAQLLRMGVDAVQPGSGAVPVLPIVDTVKAVNADGTIESTIGREWLRTVQTPQIFWRAALVDAHRQAKQASRSGTDDAALLEAAGYPVKTFPGEQHNFKITTPFDLRLAERMLTWDVTP